MQIKTLITALLLGVGLSAGAQNTAAQRFLESQENQPPLQGSVWGVLAVDNNGNVLIHRGEGQRLVPASTLKLVTCGAALHAFGAEHRFTTRLAHSGNITADGTLEGDLYLIGGGDPTLGARDSIALRPEALFWKWKTILGASGIRRIHGRIIGDGSAWEGMLEHPSWSFDDTGTYYGTGSNALCFYGNAVDLEVRAAAQAGQPVTVRQRYPETPWMHFSNYAFTGPAGSGNSLYLYTTDLAPYSELRGTYALDRKPKTEHFANKFGALTCARYFWKNLTDTGWEVTGGYADVDPSGRIRGEDFVPGENRTPLNELHVLGTSEGPPLKQIVRETLVRSDNFYAESLLRAMGEAASGTAVYDSCLVALNAVVEDLMPAGENTSGRLQADGSGLSRMNSVSPQWMVDFLRAMQNSPSFPAFLSALPHPGEGTLQGLLPGVAGRERFCLKSGSMGGTLCYAGYLLDADGRPAVTLAILVNNSSESASRLRSFMSQLLLQLLAPQR